MKANSKRFLLSRPTFQMRYAAWLAMIAALLVIFYLSSVLGLTIENYNILVELSALDENLKVQFKNEMWEAGIYLLGFSILFIFICFGLGIMMARQISLPLLKFKKALQTVKKDGVSMHIHTHKADEFADVYQEFNKFLDQIEVQEHTNQD